MKDLFNDNGPKERNILLRRLYEYSKKLNSLSKIKKNKKNKI